MIGLSALLVGCNDSSNTGSAGKTDSAATQTAPKEEKSLSTLTVSDLGTGYTKVCDKIQIEESSIDKCYVDKTYRASLANDFAKIQAQRVYDRAKGFKESVMASSIEGDVVTFAKKMTLDQVPDHLVGVPVSEVKTPAYYAVDGGLFAYTTPVSTKAIIIQNGLELSVEVEKLDKDQREFLEAVCFPEMNHEWTTCQGTIYVGLVAGDKTAHLSIIGAELKPLDLTSLTQIELKKLW